jgi:hypothetical protein
MLFLNSMTGNTVRKVPTPAVITHLQFSSSALVSGSADGYLRLHDPRTGMARSCGGEHKVVKAHQCSIQGLQTTGNYIFTIGHSERCVYLRENLLHLHEPHLLGNPDPFLTRWSRSMTSGSCVLCHPCPFLPALLSFTFFPKGPQA